LEKLPADWLLFQTKLEFIGLSVRGGVTGRATPS
jgi:hypothetical protein